MELKFLLTIKKMHYNYTKILTLLIVEFLHNDSCNNHTKSQVVNFILIDIDISIFNNSKQALDKQLNRILKNINKVFGLVPSVVWSSNGYHIYIQIEPLNTTLEETPEFSRFKEPSKEFLRFV